MRRSPWIICLDSKYNNMHHYTRKTEGNLTTYRGKENVKMEQREFKDTDHEDGGDAATSQGIPAVIRAERCKEQILRGSLQREYGPTDTFILDQ